MKTASKPKKKRVRKKLTAGRPSTLTRDLMLKITGVIETGVSPCSAMLALGIPESTMHEWLSKGRSGMAPYADLVLSIKQAESKSFQRAEKVLGRLISKGDIKATTWFLERRFRQLYKPVHHTEVSGPNGSPLEVQSLQGMATTELIKLANTDEEDSTDDTH